MDTIHVKARVVTLAVSSGEHKDLAYDRLIVTTGSRLSRSDVPGLAEYTFSVDNLDDAIALDRHLHGLADLPLSIARDTVVVAGGGLTGIEVATEMPERLRVILGANANPRVIIVERHDTIAPDMGMRPRPIIEAAFRKLGLETRLGVGVRRWTGQESG